MPADIMEISVVGEIYQLKREQWHGQTAQISKDDELLEKVKSYTWTYTNAKHPYLNSGKMKSSLHKFVLCHKYGADHVNNMLGAGNIIEHLDNNGLNCAYENLHIISSDLNKAKAFTVDKMKKNLEDYDDIPAFVTDVYYLHSEKIYQMQVFMNDDLYYSYKNGIKIPVEMFTFSYYAFDDLYIDWFYLMKSLELRRFDIIKFHTQLIFEKLRPYFELSEEEINQPLIIRDGELYINLDANENGKETSFVNHTSLRKIDYSKEQ